MTEEHPAIFYGPEDYDLFITNSVAKAALRGCGLGLFSLKATPGDATEADDSDWTVDGDGFRVYVEPRTEHDGNVSARWSPGDAFGDLSEMDDPAAITRRRPAGSSPMVRQPVGPAGSRCPARSASGNQCDLLLYSDGTHWDFANHITAATGEEWSANPTQSEAMMIAGRAVGDGLAAGLRYEVPAADPMPTISELEEEARRMLGRHRGDWITHARPAPLFFEPGDLYYPTPDQAPPLCGHPGGRGHVCRLAMGHDGLHCSITQEELDEDREREDLSLESIYGDTYTMRYLHQTRPFTVWS